ncbi:hypothetical protein GCM10027429_32100 [Marivirga atlantica]|jgi:hypothetical protein|uniref:Lipocalin-like domain-containing protein n=1 Tax=Marivirga atlantica TaxID=1548457 RepID=A0A937AHE2_9BACT|nr:hypothetical protein [Marivirga atlantica]MBL0766786.1 hypothetical protein [Marivirga atlantica]
MRKYFNYIIVLGIAVMAISCAEPENPTAARMAEGEWFTVETYVSGQVENSDLIERFILEQDGNFILEDGNGVLSVGTWSASDDMLTLSVADTTGGGAINLEIITMTYQKAHLVQNLSGGVLGDVEIRYLMNKDINDERYD